MARVSTRVEKVITVNSGLEQTFKLLSDLKEAPKYVPGLEKSETIDDVTFHWTFEPVGFKGINITVSYTVKYTVDAPDKVSWETVAGSGNAESTGAFMLKKVDDNTTEINLKMEVTVEAPIPRLLTKMAKPFLNTEAVKLIDGYLENLKNAL